MKKTVRNWFTDMSGSVYPSEWHFLTSETCSCCQFVIELKTTSQDGFMFHFQEERAGKFSVQAYSPLSSDQRNKQFDNTAGIREYLVQGTLNQANISQTMTVQKNRISSQSE